jgi:hypothetical protein
LVHLTAKGRSDPLTEMIASSLCSQASILKFTRTSRTTGAHIGLAAG